MTRLNLSACIAVAGLMLNPLMLSAQETSSDPRWTWDLTDLYASEEDWNLSLEEALAGLDEVRSLKGTLSNGPEALLTAFKTNSEWGPKGLAGFHLCQPRCGRKPGRSPRSGTTSAGPAHVQ